MAMRDYICHIADLDVEAATVSRWATKVEGEWGFHLPPLCDCLSMQGYTDLGTPGDADGVGYVPPTLATGDWFIVSIGNGNPIPEVVAPYVVAEADREVGIVLPEGIAGLSTIWAGMIVRTA